MRICVGLVGAFGLGCSGLGGPPPEPATLLTAAEAGGSCTFEVVRLPDGAKRTLATAKGRCPPSVLFAPDGKRFFVQDPALEIDLDPPGSHPLPKFDPPPHADQAPESVALHLDPHGAPFWEVVWGEGDPIGELEGGADYASYRKEVFALDGGVWREQAEVVTDGVTASPAKARYDAASRAGEILSSFEVAGFVPGESEPDAGTRKALEAATGAHPDRWKGVGPVAWGIEEGEGESAVAPVLLRAGDRWTSLTGRDSGTISVALRGRWLAFDVSGRPAHVFDTTTGKEIWSGPHDTMFWPDKVPSPAL